MVQLSFADIELGGSRKKSRVSAKLDKIDSLVDWEMVLELIKVVDRSGTVIGGSPPPVICSAR